MTSAVVVGSGPNGLSAAAHLARSGVEVTVLEAAPTIGGGARSGELMTAGLIHDHCSAVHQVAAASPALRGLDLGRHGLEWLGAPVDCAHPLDDGSAGVLYTSIDRTVDALGVDGRRWRRMFEPLLADFAALFDEVTRPVQHVPRHPLLLARFGARAALPGSVATRLWSRPDTQALFAGVAAHAYHPLDRPLTSAVAMMLFAAGHEHSWVVAKGGTQSIVDAMAADLTDHGGMIETGVRVRSAAELSGFDIVMLDVAPSSAADILGDQLPTRVARAYRRFRHGPGAFKIDFAVDGGVPWTAEAAAESGTVHLGGTAAEVIANEAAVHRGEMPERPFVLVGQQYVADSSRSAGSVHPLWAYAHVPAGYSGDATEAITAQIERFAPGFRDRIVGMAVRSTTELSVYNPNFIGGDIIGGASTPTQLLFRPRVAADPYATGIPGVYLCSASTPPGAGAHGLGGYHAARRALARLPDAGSE